jgi:hypothetical protein
MTARAAPRASAMNRLEAAYAQHLELQRAAGVIRRWDYEPERLLIGNRCTYLPDFRIVGADDVIEMHEVKGFMRDDALVKLKVAASMHPYRFVLVRRIDRVWRLDPVPPRGAELPE